jgi:phage-related protein
VYRIDVDAVVVAGVFSKKAQKTPLLVIEVCRKRFKEYDDATKQAPKARK